MRDDHGRPAAQGERDELILQAMYGMEQSTAYEVAEVVGLHHYERVRTMIGFRHESYELVRVGKDHQRRSVQGGGAWVYSWVSD